MVPARADGCFCLSLTAPSVLAPPLLISCSAAARIDGDGDENDVLSVRFSSLSSFAHIDLES